MGDRPNPLVLLSVLMAYTIAISAQARNVGQSVRFLGANVKSVVKTAEKNAGHISGGVLMSVTHIYSYQYPSQSVLAPRPEHPATLLS